MKASIKFRDDERPLMRAKVPIALLGLPFQSGLAAGGDPRELRFDVSTAFASGPALRLSYRPNDPGLPLALTVRAGLGPLGSPARAPFALAAEFNLLAPDPSSSPAFFLRLKPRLGDFSLSHTLRSPAAAKGARKVGEPGSNGGGGGGRQAKLLDYSPPFTFTGSSLAADVAAAGTRSGVGALLSGMRLTTRSVLPLWGKASLRFNWGLRVPPELLADDDGGKGALAPVSKMPLLVMSKVCIEQSSSSPPRAGADTKAFCGRAPATAPALAATSTTDAAAASDGDAAFSLLRRQLESLNVDNILLRRAVEDLRAEVRSGSRAARPAAGAARMQTQMQPQLRPYHATKPEPDHHRPRGAAREAAAAAPDDVGEELKKALEARLR